jgi:GNAT superfamily N-acetyltransferase
MERAVNPQTGEVLFLVNNQWMPPAQVAKNDKGDTAYLVNNQWEIVPGAAPAQSGLASIAPRAANTMTGNEYLEQLAKRQEKQPDRTMGGSVIDAGVTALKAAIGLPEAFLGLADIPSGGTIGKFLEDAGYKPKEAKEILDTYLSEAQQYANRQVKETKGFLPTIGAALQNPSTIVTAVGESLPQMLGGAAVARGLLKAAPALSPYLAGAAGEGLLGAGASAEQIRQSTEDKLLTPKQSLSALGSGAGTAVFGVAGGKLAKKLGLDDVDTLLAGGAAQGTKSVKDFAKKATYSGISEGVFEEMPQSAQETMWMNYALDKPLLDGVPEAAAMGLVTGATMGVGATGLGSLSRRKTAATPPAEKPVAEAAPPAATPVAETPAAPPSATQDTDAMLREALGDIPAGISELTPTLQEAPAAPVEAAPVEEAPAIPAAAVEAPVEQPPSTKLIEEALPEAPKPPEAPKAEPTLKEQYDKAAKMNFMAGDAFRNKAISQEQLDKIRSDYDRIKTEYQASIPKAELTPVQQEATDIADRLEALGQKPFVTGMRAAIEKNRVTEESMEFYRTKLKQEQAKQSTLDEGIERPSEKFEWANFYRDEPKGLDKLKLFNSKAPPAVKQALQTVTDTLQALTNRLNDEGYTMYGTPSSTVPQEIKNLRSQIQMRSAGGVKLINAFEALNKGFKRSKNTTNQQNLDAAIQDIKVDAAEAQKVLQRSIPEPEEVVNARAAVADANKRVESLEYKSGSLWSALMGKLDPEEVREIFGPNPSLGEKKLQVTKKSGKRGTYISEMADNSLLDPFLPIGMRRASGNFDAAEAGQYIKDLVANKDYLPQDVKTEIEDIYRAVEPLGDLIDEYLTIEEQNRELQIAFDEQREADQAAEIVEPEGEDRAAKPSERPAGELQLTAPTKDELTAKQDEIDRLSKENERLSKEAERKAKADEEAKDFVLTGSKRDADQAAARGQKDIFAEAPAKEAPVDNKQEIADLRKEQKSLMMQIVRAGMEETPAQEARMAEIEKRISELEGKPAKAEKPVVKQRSVAEIEEELQDLEDELDGEILKEKRSPLIVKLTRLEGELDAAKGRAARAAAEEAPAEEEDEEPSYEVTTPDGNTLSYPAAYGLVNDGYKVLALDDPRTYTDKGGKQHRTFEKDGARIAVSPNQVLFEFKGRVQYGMGNPTDLSLEMLAVDPKDRGKGKATQVLKDLTKVADQYGITLYGEPVPIVNLKAKDVGLDFDQLVNLYKKFGFEFQELDSGVSNRVIVREPQAEVLPAAEPQIAGQVGFEPYTIEGDFTEIAEEQQRLMLEDQTENLTDTQVSTLEKHYGATIDTDEFFTKLREDVTNFIVKGATAVNGKIRAIIRQLANGVLAVGIAFNPQYMSQPLNVMMPIDNVRTEEVLATVPDAATAKMSEPAKRAYAVIYPALQEQMLAKDKLFIMADKPSGRVFVFNPDGSLLLEKKSLFGLAKGDLYVGDNDKPQNRITPAGLFDLKFVDAAKGDAQKRTAGDYDTGTVLAINDPDGTITIMHSVWLKEKDGAQRAAALRNDSPADSRYSFGCINVDAPTYSFLVNNHAQQMDGAALFIVPEAGVDVMSFITGKGAMSEDLARIKIKPVTKEVRTPQKQATQAEAKTKTPGREQQFFSLEKPQTLMSVEDDLVKLVNDTADSIDDAEKKRSPSLIRKIKTLTNQRNQGKLTDEEYLDRVNAAIDEDYENDLLTVRKSRVRGADFIREKLLNAKRKGFLSEEAVDLAEWFIGQNPDLVDDLGISIKAKGPSGAGGFYNPLARVITLIKERGSDLTTTHEILHHLERMMPAKIQAAIRKAWLTQLLKANKAATDPAQKLYFMALLDAHIGNNNHTRLEIPEGSESIYEAIVEQMKFANELAGGRGADPKSSALARELLLYSPTVPSELYEYFDPSEFWAVNGSDIVQARYDAVKGGVLARLKNWLREFAQKVKSLFGMKSDASIIRALDSLAKSDGQYVTDEMLGTGDYQNIKKNAFGGEMPEATWAMKESNNFDDWVQTWQDNYRDLKNVQKIITDKIGKIDDRLNAYRKETLNPGREAEQAQEFLKYEVDPLIKEMRKSNVSNEELATYLHNRYAEERNEIINAKNKSPAVKDQGSGISTENARKYLKALPADRAKVLESLAARIDGIVRGSQDILVESGQETQETISGWRKESPHYVPLKRDESELDFIVQSSSGNLGGYATAGKFGKEALGSTKTVKDILENIMLQRDRAIRRSESIRIGQALYGLAIQYPNPDFWMAINPDAVKDMDALIAEMEEMGLEPELIENILEQPKTGFVKKTTGPEGETVREVKYRVDRAYQNAKNVFPIRINGQNRFVLLNPKSPEAMRLAGELKQLNSEKLGVFFGAASTLSRWFAAVNTQYNPAFGIVNILNDSQGALVNLSTTPLAGQQADVAKSILPALRGIARDIRKERKQTTRSVIKTEYDPDNIKPEDWTSMWRLFRQAGGKTGFRDQMVRQRMDVEWKGFIPHFKFEDENAMTKAMEKIEQGPIKKKVEWFANAFSDFNDTLENTVRLAVFKVAYVDNNLSVEEAAEIAKNITVNFNKRGAKTKMVRGLYAFFNASLQGTARYAITLAGPAGGMIVKTGLAMGAVNAMWMFMAGFDDDDPPQFTKNKGFIVPTGSGDYFIWNLPPGLRAIPNTGRLLTEAMLISVGLTKSNRGLGGKIADVGSVLIDAINPFGGGTFAQTIAPTFLDPGVALAENKDSFGRPIFKEDPSLKPTPGWQRTRDSASTFSKGLAWFLNYASAGGEEFNKGFISPTGDQLDFLIGQATGGLGRDIKRSVDLGINKYEGEETPAYRVPLANRFLGETKTEASTAARFYDNVTMLARHENVLNGRIDNKGDVQGYYKENPIARYAFVANDFENDVSSLNRTMSDIRKLPDTQENKDKIKRIKEARLKTMQTLNDLVRKAQ